MQEYTDKVIKKKKKGIVFKKTMGHYTVHADGRIVVCAVSSKLRKKLVYPTADPSSIRPHVVAVKDIKTTDPIAIGDHVLFHDSEDGTGMVVEVLPRKNTLSRRAAGKKPLEQVICANIDQMIIVMSVAQPAPKWRMLDRYLADAEFLDIPPIICVTKMDLVKESFLKGEISTYGSIGYPVLLTSAVNGKGINELSNALKGKISVFVGKSGVGKTTLLNTIQPDLGLKVDEISKKTKKGRHTTSHLELFPIDMGGGIIDTPGMREFGLWKTNRIDMARLFPEMHGYIGECRFGLNCTHTHEPGCKIKQAVENGTIAAHRYQSYVRMTK